MAAIDKCYVDNYSDYQQFKEWAKDKSFVTPRGNKICISDYIFDLEEKYFDSKSIPIFNTPTYVDNYLYKNCPLKFIQDWLQDRYFRDGYSKGVPDELIQELKLPEYEPCKRVKIIKRGLSNFPFRIYNSYTNKKDYNEAYSNYDNSFIYRIGEIIEVKDFDTNRWNNCSTGIHHFITRKEAVEY